MIGGGIDYGRLPTMPSGRSLYWTGLNKVKRSLAVDLRKREGRELVRSPVTAGGDNGGALLTNIGTPWLGHGALAQARADVSTCTIEGNPDGSTAVDYTVNCTTGCPRLRAAVRSRLSTTYWVSMQRRWGRLHDAGVVARPERDPTVRS